MFLLAIAAQEKGFGTAGILEVDFGLVCGLTS